AIVAVNDAVFIFEFKLSGKATAEEALQQIDDRKYGAQYAVSDKKIIKVGVEFSNKERTISRWLTKADDIKN
ncbi:MAG: PD-(D/E)XK nuclease domain-containing protein, partial [Tannerellaceae bacterium]|nr:PD-(D/E)XK nuclease domain-containing protein [Tannerellaceae bacterium]